jgi:hypothetical protein
MGCLIMQHELIKIFVASIKTGEKKKQWLTVPFMLVAIHSMFDVGRWTFDVHKK